MSYSRYISILAIPVAIAIVFQVSLLIIVHSCKQPWPVGTNSILDTKGYTKKWYVMVNELRQLHEMSIFFWWQHCCTRDSASDQAGQPFSSSFISRCARFQLCDDWLDWGGWRHRIWRRSVRFCFSFGDLAVVSALFGPLLHPFVHLFFHSSIRLLSTDNSIGES